MEISSIHLRWKPGTFIKTELKLSRMIIHSSINQKAKRLANRAIRPYPQATASQFRDLVDEFTNRLVDRNQTRNARKG